MRKVGKVPYERTVNVLGNDYMMPYIFLVCAALVKTKIVRQENIFSSLFSSWLKAHVT